VIPASKRELHGRAEIEPDGITADIARPAWIRR
jgi:hypothetical protein